MMKKIKYTRSRLRENMLFGVAMVVWWFVGGDMRIYVCVVRRRGADISARNSCLGTGHPLASGRTRWDFIG
jgi:hypothetical protein